MSFVTLKMQATRLSEKSEATYIFVRFKHPCDHQIKCMASWDDFLSTLMSVW